MTAPITIAGMKPSGLMNNNGIFQNITFASKTRQKFIFFSKV